MLASLERKVIGVLVHTRLAEIVKSGLNGGSPVGTCDTGRGNHNRTLGPLILHLVCEARVSRQKLVHEPRLPRRGPSRREALAGCVGDRQWLAGIRLAAPYPQVS